MADRHMAPSVENSELSKEVKGSKTPRVKYSTTPRVKDPTSQRPHESKTSWVKNLMSQTSIMSQRSNDSKTPESKTSWIKDLLNQRPLESKTSWVKDLTCQYPQWIDLMDEEPYDLMTSWLKDLISIGVWGGGGGGGRGAAAPPNSGKQWVKFGQTVGEIRAKQEEKIGQRKLQINPFGMWMMTSHRQCPRGVLVNVQE